MKLKTTTKTVFFLLLSFFCGTIFLTAQVGIGTTNPEAGAMLDIESSDKGILIPRVTLTSTIDNTTVTPSASYGLLVFNTATAGTGNTAVTEGFYYWNNTQWVRIQGEETNWKIDGNDDVFDGINFMGTLNNRDVEFRTNNTPRFKIPGNQNQVFALANGSRERPFYSWENEDDMGFWRAGESQMTLSVDATDFFNVNANNETREFSINPTSDKMHFRIESDNETNTFFVNGVTDNVGLGTSAPNTSASLELVTDNRGLLINRVVLSSRDVAAPITTPATGLLVYNTNTAGTAPNNVSPGFYYWNGSAWIAMGGTGGKDWSLLGNSGTNATVNFIGTTDEQDLRFRTNDTERIRITSNGNVGVNHPSFTNVTLTLDNGSNDFGIYSLSSNTASVFGSNENSGAIGVLGESVLGHGVRGLSEFSIGTSGVSSNNHGVQGQSAYTGGVFLTAGVVGWGTGENGANGILAVTPEQSTTNSNIAFRAISGSTTSISSSEILNTAVNANAEDLGLYVITERAIQSNLSTASEAARFQANYNGDAIDADARDPRARLAGYEPGAVTPIGNGNTFYGGYFYSGGNVNGSYAYAGARHDGTNYKIIGSGIVSTIVQGLNANEKKTMFAAEAPEVLFEDYGTGQLVNGSATITIDPVFSKNIHVSAERPLKVFIQLEGDCKGVYVTNKSANGFTVKELQGGNANVPFSWHIVANRADEIVNGEKTVYQSLRFPNAPNKIQETSNVSKEIKEEKIEAVEKPQLTATKE